MHYNIIVAVDDHGNVITKCNNANDLAFFQKTTRNSVVIMGRVTYETIPLKFRPLKGRKNIVISREKEYEGVVNVRSLEEAFEVANLEKKNVFVMGGVMVYNEAIEKHSDLCDKVYVSVIHGEFETCGKIKLEKFPMITVIETNTELTRKIYTHKE